VGFGGTGMGSVGSVGMGNLGMYTCVRAYPPVGLIE
jgi:hypothetical protein